RPSLDLSRAGRQTIWRKLLTWHSVSGMFVTVRSDRLCCGFPWQQIIDAVDLVVRDAGEGIGEPRLRVDAVELCGFDQGVGDGRGAATGEGSYEEIVFSAYGDGPHRTFGRVVIEFQDAVVEIGPEPFHAGERIADRHGQRRLAGD